ncbi:MAG: zinc ribbon domain-containing protein, partial [Methanobacteriota archaeon]
MRFQVWYSSPARSSEFFKFKLYDDDGDLETVKAGLVFTGQRITINMPTIVAFHLRPVKGGLGSSQVEVEYKSALGQLEKANFIGKAVLRQESIAQTRRIFDSLATWSQSLAGSSKCLNCGSLIPPGNGYCGRCGTPLGPSDKAWRGTDRRRETGFR